MRKGILFITCIAATIGVKSPHHAPRVGGLGTKSPSEWLSRTGVSAAQNILPKILVYP